MKSLPAWTVYERSLIKEYTCIVYMVGFIKTTHCKRNKELKLQYIKTVIDIHGLLITLQVYLDITESFVFDESTECPLSWNCTWSESSPNNVPVDLILWISSGRSFGLVEKYMICSCEYLCRTGRRSRNVQSCQWKLNLFSSSTLFSWLGITSFGMGCWRPGQRTSLKMRTPLRPNQPPKTGW